MPKPEPTFWLTALVNGILHGPAPNKDLPTSRYGCARLISRSCQSNRRAGHRSSRGSCGRVSGDLNAPSALLTYSTCPAKAPTPILPANNVQTSAEIDHEYRCEINQEVCHSKAAFDNEPQSIGGLNDKEPEELADLKSIPMLSPCQVVECASLKEDAPPGCRQVSDYQSNPCLYRGMPGYVVKTPSTYAKDSKKMLEDAPAQGRRERDATMEYSDELLLPLADPLAEWREAHPQRRAPRDSEYTDDDDDEDGLYDCQLDSWSELCVNDSKKMKMLQEAPENENENAPAQGRQEPDSQPNSCRKRRPGIYIVETSSAYAKDLKKMLEDAPAQDRREPDYQPSSCRRRRPELYMNDSQKVLGDESIQDEINQLYAWSSTYDLSSAGFEQLNQSCC